MLPNDAAFSLVETESIVEFDGIEYIIRQVNETNAGDMTVKRVEAIERFFVDMIDSPQPAVHNGSITFQNALNFVFEHTDYTFNIVDQFTAERFENFGRENALALFKTVLDRYGAEFTVSGNTVTLRERIGSHGDFQLRYGMNIRTIDKQDDTHNFATAIEGYGGEPDDDGNYPVHETYISPHADQFEKLRWADPVVDERLSTVAGMQARLQRVLVDEPQLSMTVDFADLRAAGYTPLVPTPGDWGYIVYEPMGDFMTEARIVKIVEEFDANLTPVRTQVEVSNIRRKLTDTMTDFSRTSKAVNQLLSGQKSLPFRALDEAVRLATKALQSAQTELEFNNGIIAIDQTNANNVVLFNSAGVGISTDGGQEFRTAMTAHGIVADVITTGTLRAITVDGVEIYGSEIYGGTITQQSGGTELTMNNGRLTSYVDGDQTMIFGRYDLEFFNQQNSPIGKLTPLFNVGDPSIRGLGLEIEQDFFTVGIRQGEDNLVRPTFRSSAVESTTFVAGPYTRNNTSSDIATLSLFANTYLRGTDSPTSSVDQPAIVMTQGIAENNMRQYFGGWNNRTNAVWEVRYRNSSNSSNIRLRATNNGVEVFGDFENSSSREYKTDIRPHEGSGLSAINSLTIVDYLMSDDVEACVIDKIKTGVISEDSPAIASDDGMKVNYPRWMSKLTLAVQELSQKVDNLEGAAE